MTLLQHLHKPRKSTARALVGHWEYHLPVQPPTPDASTAVATLTCRAPCHLLQYTVGASVDKLEESGRLHDKHGKQKRHEWWYAQNQTMSTSDKCKQSGTEDLLRQAINQRGQLCLLLVVVPQLRLDSPNLTVPLLRFTHPFAPGVLDQNS